MVLVYTYSQNVYLFIVNISPQGILTRNEMDYEASGWGTITKRQGRAQFPQAFIHNNCVNSVNNSRIQHAGHQESWQPWQVVTCERSLLG